MGLATLATLRAGAQGRADFETDNNIGTALWATFINESRKRLRRLLLRACPDDFLSVTGTFTLTSSVTTYSVAALDPPLWRVKGLDLITGTGTDDFQPVSRFEWSERYGLTTLSYRLMGTTLYVRPGTMAAGDYKLWYYPAPATLTLDADALDPAEDPWDAFIVLDAAIKGRARQRKDSGDLQAELAGVAKEIMTVGADRDLDQPNRVADVYGFGGADSWGRPRLPLP